MKFECLNCGYCCIIPNIVIVDPEYINSEIIIDKTLDYLDKITAKPLNTPCPYLKFDKNNNSRCVVHNKEWFSTTVCANFEPTMDIQSWFPIEIIEKTHECIIGRYIKETLPEDWWKTWWDWLPKICKHIL